MNHARCHAHPGRGFGGPVLADRVGADDPARRSSSLNGSPGPPGRLSAAPEVSPKRPDAATAWRLFLCLALAAFMPIAGASAEPASKPIKSGSVEVQAWADREAVRPGETIQLAVRLKIAEDWHVYWRSPGGTGAPTEIRWSAPDGSRIGRTQFPVPELHFDKELEETSFILAGEPVFLTPIRLSDSLTPGQQAQFKVKVSWLACKKQCIPGRAELSLSLPVVEKASAARPANVDLFERARASLPAPPDAARHLKLRSWLDTQSARPGEKFIATLAAEIDARHHMQSHKPLQEELIPAVVFVEPTGGFEIGEVEYPKAHEREDKTLGKLSEYSGKVEFKIPVTVEEDADPSPRWIRGVFQYQICTDAGTCYPPEHIEFAIPVRMEGGAAPAKQPDDWIASAEIARIEESGAPDTRAPPGSSESPAVDESSNILTRLQDWLLSFGYFGALCVAFIGGLILNVMPCVLPVISLKILSFVRQSHEDRGRIFRLGLTYSAGILLFFGVLAALFTLGGQGWGQLFQNPRVVLALAAIVTAFAMSLFGAWAVFTPKVINRLGEKAEGEGYRSAFFTGVLATFLGTACTAPFLSAALGAASRFNAVQGAGIFLAVGIGMALPFVILAANPAWLRFVPRPGPWMATFEAGMGFFLLGTVIWLLNPLRGQLGDLGLLLSLIFLLAVALAVWIKGRMQYGDPPARKARIYALSAGALVLGWLLPFRFITSVDELMAERIEQQELLDAGQRALAGGEVAGFVDTPDWSRDKIQWRRYKRERAFATVNAGYTVFVDYTADWCANCKAMLKSAIERPETIRAMKELNVVPYTADYTLPVPEIKEDLARFKRGGVPVFVVYKPGDTRNPEILPEVITSQMLIDALKRAGPSRAQLARRP